MRLRTSLSLVVIALACSQPPLLAQPALQGTASGLGRAYAMDVDQKVVHAVSLDDGSRTTSPKFKEQLSTILLTPDGTRLLAFDGDYGVPFGHNWTGFMKAKSSQAVTILDAATMKAIARVEDVGWNVAPIPIDWLKLGFVNATWDAAGQTVTLVAWGNKDHQPELAQVDVQAAKVSRRPLACTTDGVSAPVVVVPGEKMALLCQSGPASKTAGLTLVIADLRNLGASKELHFAGAFGSVTPSPDHSVLYVVANPDDQAKGAQPAPARLHVVSLADASAQEISTAASYIIGGASDAERKLVAFACVDGPKASRIVLARGAKVHAEIAAGDSARVLQISPVKKLLYAISSDSVQLVDMDAATLLGAIATSHRKAGFWTAHAGHATFPAELAFDPKEQHAYLSFEGDDEIAMLDLAQGKNVRTIDLESGWSVFGKDMVKIAAVQSVVDITSTPLLVAIRRSFTTSKMLVDQDDRFLFVAGSSKLKVIDIADPKTQRTAGFRFEPESMRLFKDEKGLAIELFGNGPLSRLGHPSRPKVAVLRVDTLQDAVDQGWYAPLQVAREGGCAVTFDTKNIYCVDPLTLATIKKVSGFDELRRVIVAGK